jgi:N-acetylglutamate synthase-like GNAT family acetyltransferase
MHPAALVLDEWVRLNQLTNRWYNSEFSPLFELARSASIDQAGQPQARVFLALESGERRIVGWAALGNCPRRKTPEIHVFVDPNWRRRGIGTELVLMAAEQARQHKLNPGVYTNQSHVREWYAGRGLTKSTEE